MMVANPETSLSGLYTVSNIIVIHKCGEIKPVNGISLLLITGSPTAIHVQIRISL
jgi:hypothetical protein